MCTLKEIWDFIISSRTVNAITFFGFLFAIFAWLLTLYQNKRNKKSKEERHRLEDRRHNELLEAYHQFGAYVIDKENKIIVDDTKIEENKNEGEKLETSSLSALKIKHSLSDTETNILELCILTYTAESWFFEMRKWVKYTFGESRKILNFLFKLKNKIQSRISLFSNSDEFSEIHSDFMKYYKIFNISLSEADFVLPLVQKEQDFQDEKMLKKYKYELFECTKKILDKYIQSNTKICPIFDELKYDEKFPWNLFGYESIENFKEMISPRTETFFNNASAMEMEFIKVILEKKQFYETEMLNEGFDYEVISETTNSLARDKYIIASFEKKDNVHFELTKVGEKIIQQLLEKKYGQNET